MLAMYVCEPARDQQHFTITKAAADCNPLAVDSRSAALQTVFLCGPRSAAFSGNHPCSWRNQSQ